MRLFMAFACLMAANTAYAEDYFVSRTKQNVQQSQAFCNKYNGDLVSITSPEEYNGLISWLYGEGHQGKSFWTGMELEPENNNTVVLADGKTEGYVKWSPSASLNIQDVELRRRKTPISINVALPGAFRTLGSFKNQYPHAINYALCQIKKTLNPVIYPGGWGGPQCKFPFKFMGKWHHQCTTMGGYKSPWCSHHTHYRFVSSYCHEDPNSNPYPDMGNDKCVFPFTHKGVIHKFNQCTRMGNHDRPWCSHTAKYDGWNWSYCE